MTFLRYAVLLVLAFVAVLSFAQAMPQPQYHIRPPTNWINDPNGPYRDAVTGRAHLYMQYNPWGALWGNMSWYHVISDDYVKWRHEVVAMYNDMWYNEYGVYSGGMVNNNFSEPVVVYTCVDALTVERQCLANPLKADLDGQRMFLHFKQSALNPIITEYEVPGLVGIDNFRDPTDWWADPATPDQWLIGFSARAVDSTGDNAHLVAFSTNDPSFQSGYNFSHFLYTYQYDPDHMFECPDFFKLTDYSEHFIKVSTMPPHRDYMIYGTYAADPTTGKYIFTADPSRTFTFADYGPRYASKSFFDPIKGHRLYWGWLEEELTNDQILAQGWSGVQTLLRYMKYDTVEQKLRFPPADELKALRMQKVVSQVGLTVGSTPLLLVPAGGNATRFHEIVVRFTLPDSSVFNGSTYYTEDTAPEFGVMIRGDAEMSKYTTVSVKMPEATAQPIQNEAQDTTYSVFKTFTPPSGTSCASECERERTCESWTSDGEVCKLYWMYSARVSASGSTSGTVNIPWLYMGRNVSGSTGYTTPLHGRAPITKSHPNLVELRVFVDDTVIEVFKDDGLESISGHVYLEAAPDQTGIALYTKNLDGVTASVDVYTMDDIWEGPAPPSVVDNFTDSLNALLTTLME